METLAENDDEEEKEEEEEARNAKNTTVTNPPCAISGEARDAELQTQFHRTAAFRHLFSTYPWLEPCISPVIF